MGAEPSPTLADKWRLEAVTQLLEVAWGSSYLPLPCKFPRYPVCFELMGLASGMVTGEPWHLYWFRSLI